MRDKNKKNSLHQTWATLADGQNAKSDRGISCGGEGTPGAPQRVTPDPFNQPLLET